MRYLLPLLACLTLAGCKATDPQLAGFARNPDGSYNVTILIPAQDKPTTTEPPLALVPIRKTLEK